MARKVFTFDPVFFFDLETTGIDKERAGIWQMAYIIEEGGVEKKRRNIYVKPVYPLFCTECKELFNWYDYPYERWFNEECPHCRNGVLAENIEPGARELIKHTTYKNIVCGDGVVTPTEAYQTLVGDLREITHLSYGKQCQTKLYPAGYNLDNFDCDFLMKWFKDVNPGYMIRTRDGKIFDKEFMSFFHRNTVIDVKHVFLNTYRKLVAKETLPDIENVKLATVSAFMEEYLKEPLLKKSAGANSEEECFHNALYDVRLTRRILEICDSLDKK